jgi:hypothetical protein
MGWSIYLPAGTLIVQYSGVVTFTSSVVNLPINPNNVQDKSTALAIPMPMPISLPIILSYGIESRYLTITGVFFIGGQTASYIEDNYLIPLRNSVYRCVRIDAGCNRYNGSYILSEFSFTEVQCLVNYFTYNMTLMAFSTEIVV